MKITKQQGHYENCSYIHFEPLTKEDFVIGEWENQTKPYDIDSYSNNASFVCTMTMKDEVEKIIQEAIENNRELGNEFYGDRIRRDGKHIYQIKERFVHKTTRLEYKGRVNLKKRQEKLDEAERQTLKDIEENSDKYIQDVIDSLNVKIQTFADSNNQRYIDLNSQLYTDPLKHADKEFLIEECGIQEEEKQINSIEEKIFELRKQLKEVEEKRNEKITIGMIKSVKDDDNVVPEVKTIIIEKLETNGIKKKLKLF